MLFMLCEDGICLLLGFCKFLEPDRCFTLEVGISVSVILIFIIVVFVKGLLPTQS